MANATIRTSGLPANFKPKPQTQGVADAVEAKFGPLSYGSYAGHEPTPDLAIDIFVNKEQGDRVAAWLVENIERLGIDYVIWWQRIYNPEIATHWRDMPDRGSPTANHRDHVHVSLEAKAPAGSPPIPQEDDMYDSAARDEVVGRLDKLQGGLDEVFKKVAFLEQEAGVSAGKVDIDKLAAALSERLGDDVAKALGERLAS